MTSRTPRIRPTSLRTHRCGDLRREHIGEQVRLTGWVARRREHGEHLAFVDLRDTSGVVQCVVAEHIDARSEYVVAISGTVRARPDGTINANLATGEIEIQVGQMTLLAESQTPPFPLDSEVELDEMLRLRHRTLDLRRRPMVDALVLRHEVVRTIRETLSDEDFLEIETPILTRSTPEGARDFLVPSRLQPRSWYALPQSPQLYKQLLMVSGYDRYFQIARCFRDEDLRADRQPEFTQIDVEASFVAADDILDLTEGLLEALWQVGGASVTRPFRRMTYADAMERYGTDRPDLRYGLEIQDATALFRDSDFTIARAAIEHGGRVRAIRIPGGGVFSRKQVDELESIAKGAGAGGLLRLKRVQGALEGPVAKFISEEAGSALGLLDGDLCLMVAAADRVSSTALDRVRQEAARRLDLIDARANEFLWVTDFPAFERDAASGEVTFVHHPFTAPHPDDVSLLDSAPEQARALAYDVVLNGLELGGGSIRISDPRLQERVFSLLGLDAETAESRFSFLLEGLRAGAPPHGGIALGMDRIAMLLAGATSLRDVIAFPKTTAARALFEGAPTVVSDRDLRELHIAVREEAIP